LFLAKKPSSLLKSAIPFCVNEDFLINLGRPSFVLGLQMQNSHTANKTIQFGFDFIKHQEWTWCE